MIPATLYKDFYKADHRHQYPKNTTKVYSNLTARISRIPGIGKVLVFGLQAFANDFLIRRFNESFFKQPKEKAIAYYNRRMNTSLGKGAIATDHLEALHDLQYLPVEVKALAEGTLCPLRVPFLTITNTHPDFGWLPNFLETLISMELWHPITVATIAFEYRKKLEKYAKLTSDTPDFVKFQGHDFSMRGQVGLSAALASGGAHLTCFQGTDTIPAIDWLEHFYGADADKELIGGSIYATEHAVMCLGGQETEFQTYMRLITEVYPEGFVSIVSDTWDYWFILTDTLVKLKDVIMNRNGKVVIRPDSGDPVKIICGDKTALEGSPEWKGSIQILWEIFGGTVNSKGYKQLDPHIGLIYGDSITLDICEAVCSQLESASYASTNVVFGIGSYTYQYVTRDTFGMAMKATYGEVDGKKLEIYKDPKTDGGVKKSAKGLLRVNEDLTLSECVTPEEEATGELKTIFKNGYLQNPTTLSEIRARVERNLL